MTQTLTQGTVYEIESLTLHGWTTGDGSGHEGYHVGDYFDAGGRYLGPDQHGIEPIVAVQRPPVEVIEAVWLDEDTGDEADHADLSRGYYEATLPDGARITSADRYCPGMIGDVWHEDDGHGGATEADSPEFHAATIRLIGGPRNGEIVA